MKKILLLVLSVIFLGGVCFAEIKQENIAERITILEKAQETDTKYFQQLQQETNNVSQRIIARAGAINELKDLMKGQDEKPATDTIPLIHN